MTINIIQTITNILNYSGEVLKTRTSENYIIYPAEGKAIKNIANGKIFTSSVTVGPESNLKNYVEIDIEE